MITDVSDTAAERIRWAVYSEMADVRAAIEDMADGVSDAIDTLEGYNDEPNADERIADALAILRNLQ